MKKNLIRLIAVMAGLLLLSSVAMASDYSKTVRPGNGIVGTAHDLRDATATGKLYNSEDLGNAYVGGTGLDRICVWCHAPHHTLKTADAGSLTYYPLWNHKVTTVASYTMYDAGPDSTKIEMVPEVDDLGNPTGNMVLGNHSSQTTALKAVNQPGSVSKLCLSCHDGSVGVNEYGFPDGDLASRGPGGKAVKTIEPQYKIGAGGNLQNHHPIGFKYADVEKYDDEIQKGSADMTPSNTIESLLWNEKMECTTCHDVHNTKNSGEKFLWKSDKNSEFCLTCHLKADIKK